LAKKKKSDPFRVVLGLLYALAVGTFLFFLLSGASYYLTSFGQRPRHAGYAVFRPAGSLGLAFGLAGAAMLVSLLFYSMRKRTKLFGSLFRIKYWLQIHILFGIAGPLFILLHTSFKLNGLVSVSFWSMVAVALSGVFGRYLYIQIPRNIRGDELTVAELEKQDEILTEELHAVAGMNRGDVAQLMEILYGSGGDERVTPWQMILGDIRRKWQLRGARRAILSRFSIPRSGLESLMDIALQKSLLRIRIARSRQVHKWFHYWHVIHRPFAVVMYLIMVIHIVVALLFGISWRGF